MIHNEIHHRGYIAKTYGKKSLVILREDNKKEVFHTSSYAQEGEDSDLKDTIDVYLDIILPMAESRN